MIEDQGINSAGELGFHCKQSANQWGLSTSVLARKLSMLALRTAKFECDNMLGLIEMSRKLSNPQSHDSTTVDQNAKSK